MSRDISNEILILRSYPLIEETVLELGFNVYQYRKTAALERVLEIYGVTSPFSILARPVEPNNYRATSLVEIKVLDEVTVQLVWELDGAVQSMNVELGEEFQLDGYWLKIENNHRYSGIYSLDDEFLFSVANLSSVVNSYRNNLLVRVAEKEASVVQLLIDSRIPAKETAFLDALLANYIERNLKEKNEASSNSINFIDEELGIISDSLRRIEARLQYFKSNNQIADLGREGEQILERLMLLDAERGELLLKQKYFKYIDQYLNAYKTGDVLIHPSSFGLEDTYLSGLASKVIALENDRRSMGLENSSLRNNVDAELIQMRQTLREYVKQLEETNVIKLQDVNERLNVLEGSIEGLSSSEIQLMNINRLHSLSESLFLLLMEKKAEAQILRSSNTPDYVVIEPARLSSPSPVSPKKSMWYGLAMVLGLALPIGVIITYEFFDDKIRTKEDLAAFGDLTFLGSISSVPKKQSEGSALRESPKSRLAESFRTLRASMNYLRASEKKVILVTSYFPSEGKTFIVSNLAQSLSLGRQNVVIIGGDLRKPRVHQVFDVSNDIGLSSYLASDVPLEDIIKGTNLDRVKLIPSGPIPPNPLELLEEEKFADLLVELRSRFDYILIDTPPFGLVSDMLALIEKADVTLLITRSGKTRKLDVLNIQELVRNHPNGNFGLVLNDVKQSQGYRYRQSGDGYGYYEA